MRPIAKKQSVTRCLVWQAVIIGHLTLFVRPAPLVWSASDSQTASSNNASDTSLSDNATVPENTDMVSEGQQRAQRLKELYVTRIRIQEIYREKKQELRDKLQERLKEIDQEGGDFKARQAVKRGWRVAHEYLKKAYKIAFLQCQKEIDKLEVKSGYRHKVNQPINIFKGTPITKNKNKQTQIKVIYPHPTR